MSNKGIPNEDLALMPPFRLKGNNQPTAEFPRDLTAQLVAAMLQSQGAIPGRLLNAPRIFVAAGGPSSYTPLSGDCVALYVELVGGGGGGGGGTFSSPNKSFGGGGGAGGYAAGWFAVAGATLQYTIGANGTAGSSGGGNGGNGGDSIFTDNLGHVLTAKGGLGGTGQTAGTGVIPIDGGAGGAIATGGGSDLLGAGAPGLYGLRLSGTSGISGSGGSSIWGGGGVGQQVQGANPGKGPGAGGSGAAAQTASVAGGVGIAGGMRVWEFG